MAPKLLPWIGVIEGCKFKEDTPEPERELHVPGLKLIAPVTYLFAAAYGHLEYSLMKSSFFATATMWYTNSKKMHEGSWH